MKAPKHFPCGTEHWSNEPCPAFKPLRIKVTEEILDVEDLPCESITTTEARSSSPPKSAPKLSSASEPSEDPHGPSVSPTSAESAIGGTLEINASETPKPKTDRKEYLKLKARERRAADREGLTVAQYRARKAQEDH